MKYKTIVLALLATGSIAAMDHDHDPGIWDEHGNYIAPARYGDILYLPFYWPMVEAHAVVPLFRMPEQNKQPIIPDYTDTDDNDVVESSAFAAQTSQVVVQEASAQPESTALVAEPQPAKAKKNWADDDSDDELPSLPADWIRHAKPVISSCSTKPVLSKEIPPRFVSRNNPGRSATVSRAVIPDPVEPLESESANWRERILFDDRLALAARNGHESRQQFIQLLDRKIYWLAGRCYDRKVANESERLIYILDQNLIDPSINITDAKSLLRLATVCLNSRKKRTSLKADGKQGLACVARKLCYLALSAPLDELQKEKVQYICDQIEPEQGE